MVDDQVGIDDRRWQEDDALALDLGRKLLREFAKRGLATRALVRHVTDSMGKTVMVDHAMRAALHEVRHPLREDERIAHFTPGLHLYAPRLKAEFYRGGVDDRAFHDMLDGRQILRRLHWSCVGRDTTPGYKVFRIVRPREEIPVERLVFELGRQGYRPACLDELDALARAHPDLVTVLPFEPGIREIRCPSRLVAMGEMDVAWDACTGRPFSCSWYAVSNTPAGPALLLHGSNDPSPGNDYVFIRMPGLGRLPFPAR